MTEYLERDSTLDLKTEVRHLPDDKKKQLAQFLENIGNFDRFMLAIPKSLSDFNKLHDDDDFIDYERKYNEDHVRAIKNADPYVRRGRLNGEILFDEWGTSGIKRPRIVHLIKLLQKIGILRAANLIRVWINVKEVDPMTNASASQSNPIDLNIANTKEKEVLDEILDNHLPLITMLHNIGDTETGYNGNHLDIPTFGESTDINEFKYNELKEKTNDFNDQNYIGISKQGRSIGSGGFGKVFLAIDLIEGIQFAAVKVLMNKNYDNLKYFIRELKTISELDHPNIIKLLGYSIDVKACLIFEYAFNGSLKDKLKNAREMKYCDYTFEDRIKHAFEIATALKYLHVDKKLVHRDIKPGNILLDLNVAKLCDFGLIWDSVDGSTTRIIGTDFYMAPEMAHHDITFYVDVYAFGIVMLEAFTGLEVSDKARSKHYLRDFVRHRIDLTERHKEIMTTPPGMPYDSKTFEIRLQLIKLSLECAELNKYTRPLIEDVHKKLETIMENYSKKPFL